MGLRMNPSQTNMAQWWLALCVLVALVTRGFSYSSGKPLPQKNADKTQCQRQIDILKLTYHIYEPIHFPEQKTIANSWSIKNNLNKYNNVTAVNLYIELMQYGLVPRGVPFSVLDHFHRFEAITLFNVLYSAKDYETFFNTAVHVRDVVNEGLFVYVLQVVLVHRHDTQGIVIPPIYEILPSYFFNGEIMTTAQRINTHGHNYVEHYPSTYLWNNNVVIKWNETMWPYFNSDNSIAYYTHDHVLSAFYYNMNLIYPSWLGGEVVPLVKDRRGEWFWFLHKQIVARYYMERLSNGLGEIPTLGSDVVPDGYVSGLVYHNGIPFPVRPNHYHLNQPQLIDEIETIITLENRIRDAIDSGFIINSVGENVNIHNQDAIDIVGSVIQANVDSVNKQYYQDFISIWQSVLGNSVVHDHQLYHSNIPLVVPSVLENYQTAVRDPAFYMIYKRVLNIFNMWQEHLPRYTVNELALPSVQIQNVDVDKLVTYFENTYVNVTNYLYSTEQESVSQVDHVTVLVQRPQLNHKAFEVRVKVKSDVAKTVVVRFFLAPKYDSYGNEIPLHVNTQNFYQLDQFTYDLPQGETVIKRVSTEIPYAVNDWTPVFNVLLNAENALNGHGQFVLNQATNIQGFPQRLLLPKGRVGGMHHVLLVYISEYRAPKVPYGTGYDPSVSLGTGTGARHMTDDPLGFPLNRPLHQWQIENIHNIYLEDVLIYHKHTPEIVVPHTE